VLGDLIGASCAAVNRHFGSAHSPADAGDYALTFLREEQREWLRQVWYETSLLEELDPYRR
jgi:hypothetical protein